MNPQSKGAAFAGRPLQSVRRVGGLEPIQDSAAAKRSQLSPEALRHYREARELHGASAHAALALAAHYSLNGGAA